MHAFLEKHTIENATKKLHNGNIKLKFKKNAIIAEFRSLALKKNYRNFGYRVRTTRNFDVKSFRCASTSQLAFQMHRVRGQAFPRSKRCAVGRHCGHERMRDERSADLPVLLLKAAFEGPVSAISTT